MPTETGAIFNESCLIVMKNEHGIVHHLCMDGNNVMDAHNEGHVCTVGYLLNEMFQPEMSVTCITRPQNSGCMEKLTSS